MIRRHASAHSRRQQWSGSRKRRGDAIPAGSRAWRAADRSKTMFSVGQRVWLLRDTSRSGIVVECAAGQVYIEQDNGAELDFPEGELTAQPPAQAAAKAHDSAGMAKPDHAMPSRPLTARDITPEHLRVLAAIPARTLQAVAVLVRPQIAGHAAAKPVQCAGPGRPPQRHRRHHRRAVSQPCACTVTAPASWA